MRIGADTGGTFTDLVADDGRIVKVPSTPNDPAQALAHGIDALFGGAHGPALEVLAHGTTVATNTLLERSGARVALVTTAGFADVIEIARQVRPSLYDQHVDRALPWLLRGHAHILSTEASAMLFGRLSKNPVWLREWAGADPAALAAQADAVSRAVREQLLVQSRWMMVMVHMERALYRDPDQDLRALWWDLVERFQWVRRPEGRHAPDWAAKIHFSIAPVYYHNYQLGEMLASQLQDHLLKVVLGGGDRVWERYVRSPEVADFLIPN